MKECPACHRCFADGINHCPKDGDALRFLFAGDPLLDGRYQLERKIGHGGMGMVFEARHVFLKTRHAVKVILPELVGNDPTLTTRFRQEAMAAAAIRHPRTVSVTDYGVIGGTTPYLVMEYIEGRSLHDLLVRERRLSPMLAVEIALAVCEGVAAAHRAGIVHRDLKPLNILLKEGESPREAVKVLDFGLAKIKSGELLGSFVAAQTQGLMGSPFYMAPEQWGDDDVDVRADIYSLGILLYQMLSGDVPFGGRSIPSIMNKHLTAAPVPLSERGAEVPQAVESVVRRALEKEPGRRQQTVDELMDELREALVALGASSQPTTVGAQTSPRVTRPAATMHDGLPGAGDASQRPEAGILRTAAGGGDHTSALEADSAGASTVAEPPGSGPHVSGSYTSESHASVPTVEPRPERPSAGYTSPARSGPEAPTEPLPPAVAESFGAGAPGGVRAGLHAAEMSPSISPPASPSVLPAASSHAAGAPAGAAQPAASSLPLLPLLAVAAVVVLLSLGGLAYYFSTRGTSVPEATGDERPASPAATGEAPAATGEAPVTVRADLVSLPGGAFRVGRDDVPPITEQARRTRPEYLLWMYQQWPSRAVSLAPFAIDRTEVTNEEYAEFVRQTGHPAPAGGWEGDGRPAEGQLRLPVTNVSLGDAVAFAAWRSKRDGVTYRLPTEEEWEYAARGGDASRDFPWGPRWVEGRANLGGSGPAPVGSFAAGDTPQGASDLIGNVWELTSTEAGMYEGNDRTELDPADRGKVVVRGGSFESRPDGDKPITATARLWVSKDFRSPALGFRLVRPGT
jgi:serine/threonine-protein kinase